MSRFSDEFAQELERSRSARARQDLAWDLARLFLSGRQWVRHDRSTDRLRIIDDEDRRYRCNLIKPLYKYVVSALWVQFPSMSILPASPSNEDIVKARVSLEAIRSHWASENMEAVYGTLIEWLACCGNAAFHTFYDPDDDTVHTEVVSPYDYFLQAGVDDAKAAGWAAARRRVDKFDLADKFPKHRTDIEQAPGAISRDTILGDDKEQKDVVDVFDVYYSDGTHEVRLEHTVLDSDEWDTRTFPLRHVWYMRVPGLLYGDGLVMDLVDLQFLYNVKNEQLVRAIDNFSDPWIAVPAGSVAGDAFQQGANRVIHYSPSHGAPQILTGAGPTPEAFHDIGRIEAKMLDVAGAHSTSLGKTAKGVNSAKHTEALQRADASQLQPSMGQIEMATIDVVKTILFLQKQNYTKTRWMKALDDTGALVSHEIKNTSIVDAPEIVMEPSSLFRAKTADRKQEVLDLFSAELISAEDAMQEMAFGTSGRWSMERVQAIQHGKELLNAAKAGFDIEVFLDDDIPSIRRVFAEFMRDPVGDFYKLPVDIQHHIAGIYQHVLGGAALVSSAGMGEDGREDLAEALGERIAAMNQDQAASGMPQVPGRPIEMEPGGPPADDRTAVGGPEAGVA